MRRTRYLWSAAVAVVALSVAPLALQGCGGDSDDSNQVTPAAGSGGSGGSAAGSGGSAGTVGSAGEGGEGGEGGQGGDSGSAGSAGAPVKLTAVVDLRADTNRDGKIDLSGDADDKDEDMWDKTHGAIFLANIDDDEKKCSTKASDIDLPKCHDAADDVINGPDDLADLARLKTAPWAEAPDDASGKLSLDATSAERVRLFKNDGSGTFTVFNPATDTLSAAELRSGVELAIEGKDIVRDLAVWDGYADVTFQILGGTGPGGEPAEGGTDTVRLRLAPVLTHHHLQPTEQVYVAGLTGIDSSLMRADLKKANTAAKVPKPVIELKSSAVSFDQWTQDYFETGYMTMPGPDGPTWCASSTARPTSTTRRARPTPCAPPAASPSPCCAAGTSPPCKSSTSSTRARWTRSTRSATPRRCRPTRWATRATRWAGCCAAASRTSTPTPSSRK